jgi:hypothetical protein
MIMRRAGGVCASPWSADRSAPCVAPSAAKVAEARSTGALTADGPGTAAMVGRGAVSVAAGAAATTGGLPTTGPEGGLVAIAGAGVAAMIFGAWRGCGTTRRGAAIVVDAALWPWLALTAGRDTAGAGCGAVGLAGNRAGAAAAGADAADAPLNGGEGGRTDGGPAATTGLCGNGALTAGVEGAEATGRRACC